jgi:MSHA biogenesis protein MshJ
MNLAARLQPMSVALAPLQARLTALLLGFDRKAPRERMLMIAVAVVLTLAAVDTWLVAPAFKALKAARLQHRQALDTQRTLQTDSVQMGSAIGAHRQVKQAELTAWRQRAREGENLLRAHEDTLIGPEQMMTLLEQVLARHGQVRVRAMRLLERVDLLANRSALPVAAAPGAPAASATPAAAPAAPGAAALAGGSLYRHGVELVLEGGFNDLLAYLQALEAMPQHVLWGAMNLQVQQHPQVQLTLRLYTISRERHGLAM